MSYLAKRYKQQCKKVFGEYGFRNYRNYHYRIVNDIFQSFYLHISVYKYSCTVEFAVIPLAADRNISKTTCGFMHLKVFENSSEWFWYDKCSKESIGNCVDSMIQYMQEYLMPLFEKCKDSQSAYEGLSALQKEHYSQEEYIFEFERLYMALKNKSYELATTHLENLIKQTKNAYNVNKKYFCNGKLQRYQKKITATLDNYSALLRYAQKKDELFFDTYLKRNEEKNIKRVSRKSVEMNKRDKRRFS